MTRLAIVSPCYNEEAVLNSSVARLTDLLDALVKSGEVSDQSMIVFVNDGSSDATWQLICEHQRQNKYVRGINLARNVGHQNAIMAGMLTARHWVDVVITIDADLQDDLAAIPRMLQHYREGSDIVYGVKVSRKADPVFKRLSAVAFYKLQSKMGVKSVFNHADFRLMSRRALDILAGYGERNLYLRGLIPMIGLESSTVDDVISERTAGTSKYTLKKMLSLALDGITSFSVRPIYLILYIGFFFIFLSLVAGVYVVHALVVHTAYPGWASIMLSLWLIGGVILLSIGIVGVYVGKIYTEVKNRPLFNICEIVGDDDDAAV
ncbi:glycosyltransferase family 2 protein [Hoylesella shahii]|uniref:glycosyltransferase family 2 protein n=1 Tax=Hoylesella shahii TaxID=228603 RepID=UPI0028E62D29|nr:glycosyltransferase family 2 protein [Hoylesella shahii]